jgi:thiol-disulfide isomerase/thioredoxin
MPSTDTTPPHALLLVGPGCPYCAQMLESLGELVKDGAIARLEVVNVAAEPDVAQQYGVRSVPWTRIGPLVLEGAHTTAELRHWSQESTSELGLSHYIDDQLQHGGLARVDALIREEPTRLLAVLPLIADRETSIQTRVGIGALLEGLEDTGLADELGRKLLPLLGNSDARVRADVCHYLGLSGNAQSIPELRPLLEDEDSEVREITAESIAHLEQKGLASA